MQVLKHVMIDLETLGFYAGCKIVSIGAVEFDPKLGEVAEDGFYQTIVREGQFLREDESTVKWWDDQSPDARRIFTDPDRVPLSMALLAFNNWLPEEAAIWGNGANFDQPILTFAMQASRIKPRWDFWNERCYRTVKNLAPHIKLKRTGTHHNALDDARCQAQHLIDIVQNTTLTLA